MQKGNFYLFFGADNPLSNWHPARFVVKGKTFEHNEMFLMYCKAMLFGDLETAEKILAAPTPKECKRLGREVTPFDEAVWVAKREFYNYYGALHKFQQNPQMAEFLLLTGDLELVEASKYDRIWGVGLDAASPSIVHRRLWLGTNLHGIGTQRVRDELRAAVPLNQQRPHDHTTRNDLARAQA
ncbi:hypothetical protein D3C71_78890 [compost metagenome]